MDSLAYVAVQIAAALTVGLFGMFALMLMYGIALAIRDWWRTR